MHEKLTAVIIEDQPGPLKDLQDKLHVCCSDHVAVVGTADTCASGVSLLQKEKPDLLFLDVMLPDGDGFSVLEHYKNQHTAVIFVTGYQEYAIQAMRMSAVDFLVKPVKTDELGAAIDRAVGSRHLKDSARRYDELIKIVQNPDGERPLVTLKTTADGFVFFYLENVVCLTSVAEKTQFLVIGRGGVYEANRLLKEFEQTFEPYRYMLRVQRGHIANLLQVVGYNPGNGQIMLSNGTHIKIGGAYEDEFIRRMNELGRKVR